MALISFGLDYVIQKFQLGIVLFTLQYQNVFSFKQNTFSWG